MRRLIQVSLSTLLAASLSSCGSDSSGLNSAGGNSAPQTYQGVILGRVKLTRELQAGPIEVLDDSGQLLYTARAGENGFFYWRGTLPTDFRLRAVRGGDAYESEYHGGWRGGTLYINPGTTLATAYHRAHPDLSQQECDERMRRFMGLPPNFPMTWVGTIRARGFDTKAFLAAVRASGGLRVLVDRSVQRLDATIRPEAAAFVGNLIEQAATGLFQASVNTAVGDSVANMGFNFTTAGALSNVEEDLAIISQQITDLSNDFEQASAAAKLAATLAPLKNDASQINASVANITNTIQAFINTHPNPQDYNVPSVYPPLQDTISQVQSLNLTDLTNPIRDAVTNTGSQGVYRLLVNEQMSELGQSFDSSYNGYPWRSNQLTLQQIQMMGSFVTALEQSGYLQCEYANLQTDLATSITQAAVTLNQLAHDMQVASQQVPDLLPSDELIFDPVNRNMWFASFLNNVNPDFAVDVIKQLEIGPYDDFCFPPESVLETMVRNRIGPATSPQIATRGTGNWSDVSFGTWSAAFEKMGIAATGYDYETQSGDRNNNEGCYYYSTANSYDTEPTTDDLRLYEWNGTNRNPSSSSTNAVGEVGGTTYTNVLACRTLNKPERFAPLQVPPPFAMDPHANDDPGLVYAHPTTPIVDFISPLMLPVTFGAPNSITAGTRVESNSSVLGVQLTATNRFFLPAGLSYFGQGTNPRPDYDITQRVAWKSSNETAATVSNFQVDPDAPAPTGAPGKCGFVTWHPPLDGSQLPNVTITAELFAIATTSGGSTTTVSGTYNLVAPSAADCKPVVSQVYAVPNNQVIDVSQNTKSVLCTLLAFYQDGRVFDVSTDDATTWTLKDSNGAVLHSSSTGGFGVLVNTPKNSLYLSDGITTNNVTFTGDYNGRWGHQSFTGKLGLVKAPPTIGKVLPASGPAAGGQTIVITGSGFTNPCLVTFNGVPASSTFFVNSTQLSVVTPPSAIGAASVVVQTATGATSNQTFFNFTP